MCALPKGSFFRGINSRGEFRVLGKGYRQVSRKSQPEDSQEHVHEQALNFSDYHFKLKRIGRSCLAIRTFRTYKGRIARNAEIIIRNVAKVDFGVVEVDP